MNLKRLLHDFKTGKRDRNMREAVEFLNLSIRQVKTLINCGILKPVKGGGRGKTYYFSYHELKALRDLLKAYR